MLKPLAVALLALSLASCAAISKAFTPDPATGHSPAGDVAAEVTPFLPPPWGTVLGYLVTAVAPALVVHVHHKRKAKKLAAASPAAAPAKPAA